MAIGTVSQVIAQARVLLQDTIGPDYRYADNELLVNLSMGMLETRRLRPDLFIADRSFVPSYTSLDNTPIPIDQQYWPALVYYVVGMAQLRDDEESTDTRAAGFLNKMKSQLLTISEG